MKLSIADGIMIIAVLLAPLLALQAQRLLDSRRDAKGRKLWIFRTLMGTRGAKLAPDHVQALNLIDLEFTENKHEPIREKWKVYLDHLGALRELSQEQKQEQLTTWTSKGDDLLAELLQAMGAALRFKYDLVHIKRAIYSPQGYADIEFENQIIRRQLMAVLSGKQYLTTITSVLPNNAERTDRIADALEGVLNGDRPLHYQLDKGEKGQVQPSTSSSSPNSENVT